MVDKLLGIFGAFGLWVASIEYRITRKVNHKYCDTQHTTVNGQLERIESHLWDIMQEGGIQPTVSVPENIKNNSKK